MRKTNATVLFIVSAAIFIVAAFFAFKDVDVLTLWEQVTWPELVLNLCLGLCFFISFGITMHVGFSRHYGLLMKRTDLLMLPLMMHLFTYIVPIKGGMIFQTFFSRCKYGLQLSKGFSLGISVFMISLLLTVVAGIAVALKLGLESTVLMAVLGLMGLALIIFLVILRYLPQKTDHGTGLIGRLVSFLLNVRAQLMSQMSDLPLILGLLISTIAAILVQTTWYWQTSDMLGMKTGFLPMLLIVLVLRILLLVRLLPGNLGVQEMLIGLVFSSAGFSMEQGLLVALVTRLNAVTISATIGMIGLYSNLHYFHARSVFGLITKVTENQE